MPSGPNARVGNFYKHFNDYVSVTKAKTFKTAYAEGIRHVEDLDEGANDSMPRYGKCIKHIAQIVGCEPPELREEMRIVKPLASKYLQRNAGSTPGKAWGKAVHQRLQYIHKLQL